MADFPPQGEGGTGSSGSIIAQYLEVAISGKQYTSVATAVAATVGLASATAPYVVKVYPGIYTEPPFTLPQYVTIEGSEYFSTTIQTNDNTNHFITGAARSAVRNITIIGPTNSGKAAIYYTDQVPATTAPFVLQDIFIRKGYYGVWVDATVSDTIIHLINVNNWYNGVAMHTFARATGYGIIVGQNSGFMCGASDAITTGFEANGSNAELYLNLCYFRNTPNINTITGIFLDNDAYAVLNACTFSKGTIAIHLGSNSSNGPGIELYAAACVIRNDSQYFFTTDIKIDSTTAKMDFNGIASRTKLSIVPNAEFTGTFNDITSGAEGMVNLGEFYLGSLENQLPLRDYGFTTYLTGQKSGGEVTTTGLLGVHVANGAGFINTSPTVPAVKSIAWLDTNLIITANTREWIYVDNTGTVLKSSIMPNENNNIILAVAYANATDVVFLAAYVRKIQNFIGKIDVEFDEGIGNIWIEDSGLDVTENATPLRLDVTNGRYFIIFNETDAIGATPITFTYWYGSDLGGWTTVTNQTDIDVINYDNSGVLTAMDSNKWKKDALYVAVNDNASTTEYHIVYGQEQFNTQEDAENGEIPTPPSFFENYSLQLAGIVVQKSTANINKLIDIRRRGHYVPPGHNTLPGLQGGNSALSQFYHINSTEHANLSQKIIAISGSNSSISGSTITFGNSNNLSFYVTNGSIVGSFNQSSHEDVRQLNNSSGTMSIVGGDNITVNNNNSTISIFGPANILSSFSIGGNTGTTGSSNITGGGFLIAGGNNITLSQSNDTISIYGRNPQPTIKSISAGTTKVTTGEVVFSNSNGVSFGADGQTITASIIHPSQTVQTQSIINDVSLLTNGNTSGTVTDITSGTLYLAGGNEITLSQEGNSITIYGPLDTVTQFSAGISTLGNTVGTTGLAINQLVLAGGNSITLSGSTDGNSMTITISGPSETISQFSAGLSNIGNTSGTSGVVSHQIVFAGGNNITLSQSIGVGIDIGHATITISAPNQSVQTQNIFDMTVGGNTSGTLALISSGTLTLAGGNNITLSQDGNAITISALEDIVTQFSAGVSDIGNTSGITGTIDNILVLAGGNNITLSQSRDGQSGTITISAYNQTIQTQGLIKDVNIIGNTSGITADITSGTLNLAGGDNITLSQNGNAITISAAAVGAGSFTAGMSNLGNTAGTTGVVNNRLVFAGGDNMTISQSIDGQSATMTFNFATIGAGSFTAGMSNIGNTSGTSGAVQNQLVLAGGNNITLSQSRDGQSGTITISAYNQTIQTQNLFDISISGNTSGTVALISSGTLTLAGGNNITLSQNNNALTISAQSQSQQTQNIIRDIHIIGNTSGTTAHISSGTMSIAGGNNITLSQNQNSITISANDALLAGMSNLGNTSGTTGLVYTQLVFVGGDNITLNQSVEALGLSATITINAADDTITQFSAGISNLGNTVGTSGTFDNQLVFVGGNNITLSQSIDAFNHSGTITINAAEDTITLFSAGVSNLGNTAGTTGTIDNMLVFVGGNNVTLSQSIGTGTASQRATFTINAQPQSVQPRIQSLSGGTTRITTGEVIFSNANNISFGVDGQTITATVHPQQTGISGIQASDTTFTSGSVILTGSNMVTVKSETDQMIIIDATQTVQTQNMHGLVLSNNTSGLFTIGTSGTISFAATNMTITANTANSSIVGFSVHPQQTAISGIQASNTTYTSGTVILTGVGGGITVSSNTNQRIDLSVAAQSTQTQNLHGLVISNNTSGATTIGTSGTVSFAGTNITITANTANNSIIGFSVANPVGAGIGSISAGTTRITSGEAVFSNSNNISFGVSGQTVTATIHPQQTGISSIFAGTTRATSGEVIFSNANSISFGMNANTVTASFSQSIQTQSTYVTPTLSYWGNANNTLLDVNTSGSHRSFFLFPLNPQADLFPGNMTVNTMYLLFENTQSNMTNAWGKTLSIGIYTTTDASLSLINSASTSWGTDENNSAITSLFSGTRYLTIGTGRWSSQPAFSQIIYYVGMIADSSGSNIRMDMSGFRIIQSSGIISGTIGVAMTSGNVSIGKMPWIGVSTNTRSNLPTTIGLSELVKTGGLYGFIPYIQFNNIQSNF